MGVRKFRSVEEMPRPRARPPLDPENLRVVFGLMNLAQGLARLRYPPGVRRFRSWDEALAWRMNRRPHGPEDLRSERGERTR